MMEIKNYDTLLEEHAALSLEKQYQLAEIIGNKDWQLDMNTGLVTFGGEVSFPFQLLGTYSHSEGTWLWAWANKESEIPEDLLQSANQLKKLGEDYNIEFLTKEKYKIEPTDVHALGLIAVGEVGASAYYAGDFGDGIALMTMKSEDIEAIEHNEQARILENFPQTISIFEVNHRRSLINYLQKKGYHIIESAHSLDAVKGIDIIHASFDEHNRLSKMTGEIKA